MTAFAPVERVTWLKLPAVADGLWPRDLVAVLVPTGRDFIFFHPVELFRSLVA